MNRKTAGVSDTNFTDVLLEISKETMDKDKDHQRESDSQQFEEHSSSLPQEEVPPNQSVSLFQCENN